MVIYTLSIHGFSFLVTGSNPGCFFPCGVCTSFLCLCGFSLGVWLLPTIQKYVLGFWYSKFPPQEWEWICVLDCVHGLATCQNCILPWRLMGQRRARLVFGEWVVIFGHRQILLVTCLFPLVYSCFSLVIFRFFYDAFSFNCLGFCYFYLWSSPPTATHDKCWKVQLEMLWTDKAGKWWLGVGNF